MQTYHKDENYYLVYPNHQTQKLHGTRRCAQGSMKMGNAYGGFKAMKMRKATAAALIDGTRSTDELTQRLHGFTLCGRCFK